MLTMKHPQRNRNAVDRANIPAGTPATAACSIATSKWRLVFSNPVMVKALPVDFTVNGASPTAYSVDLPTQLTLTFAAPVATGQTWTIPAHSLNVRTPTGGYVAAATGTF